jgi:hypothetical protein
LNDKAVACITAARKLESLIPLWSVSPSNDLLSEREDNEAYLSVNPGKAYALYFPGGGEVSIDLSAANGLLTARWIYIDTGDWGPTVNYQGGKKIPIAPPGKGNWALAITAKE